MKVTTPVTPEYINKYYCDFCGKLIPNYTSIKFPVIFPSDHLCLDCYNGALGAKYGFATLDQPE